MVVKRRTTALIYRVWGGSIKIISSSHSKFFSL